MRLLWEQLWKGIGRVLIAQRFRRHYPVPARWFVRRKTWLPPPKILRPRKVGRNLIRRTALKGLISRCRSVSDLAARFARCSLNRLFIPAIELGNFNRRSVSTERNSLSAQSKIQSIERQRTRGMRRWLIFQFITDYRFFVSVVCDKIDSLLQLRWFPLITRSRQKLQIYETFHERKGRRK